jgi:hypothetical protein
MDQHLGQHTKVWSGGVYSEASVVLASLMGTSIHPADQDTSTTAVVYPIPGYCETFENDHGPEASKEYDCLGAFWLAVVSKMKTENRWPTYEDLITVNLSLGSI